MTEDYSEFGDDDDEEESLKDTVTTSPQTNDQHQRKERNAVTLMSIEKLIEEFMVRETQKLITEQKKKVDNKAKAFVEDSARIKAELADLDDLEDMDKSGTQMR